MFEIDFVALVQELYEVTADSVREYPMVVLLLLLAWATAGNRVHRR